MGQHTTAAEQAARAELDRIHASNGYRVSVWPDDPDARGLGSYAALDHALQTLDRATEVRVWAAMRALGHRADTPWTMTGCTHPVYREQDSYWAGSVNAQDGTHVHLIVCCGDVIVAVTQTDPDGPGRVTRRTVGSDAVDALVAAGR